MTIKTLALALGLTVAGALAMPSDAQAYHRHSRYCRHHRTYYSHSYYDPYYYDYGPPRYGYYYRDVWPPRSYVVVHYHRGVRCVRPHGRLYLRYGW